MTMVLALIVALAGCSSVAASDVAGAPVCEGASGTSACHPDSDLDLDGVTLIEDNCPDVPNPFQIDTDGDRRGDLCDRCPSDPRDDEDGDGRCADADNCPTAANASQLDTDSDGVGDSCDPCPTDARNDSDGDGHCDVSDNCPSVPNADQLDSDGDGLGQACDNCPMASNVSQVDFDGDLYGDACDEDDDGDGLDDSIEEMFGLGILNPDTDGDGVGDEEEFGPGLDPLDSDGDGLIDALDPSTPGRPREVAALSPEANSLESPPPLPESTLLFPPDAVMLLITTEWLSRHETVSQK